MKKWIALLLTAALAFSLVACSNPNEEGGDEETFKIEEKYDEYGNILMEPVYMGWNLWYYNEYTYEAKKLINKKYCNNNGDMINEWKYSYREDGVLEKVEEYTNKNGVMLTAEEFYDENGLLRKKDFYDADGNTMDCMIYVYDSQGRCIKQSYYDTLWEEGNILLSYVVYAYDNDDNCIEKIRYDRNEDPVYNWTYSYDDLGNMIKEIVIQTVDGEELETVKEYTYHDNGRVEELFTEDPDTRTEEIWDASGALTSERHYIHESSDEWFMWYIAEYSGDTKTCTERKSNGKYIVQTMKGNAEAANTVKTEYYFVDGSLYCSNSEGVFYDETGAKMDTQPDLSAWNG